MARSIIGGAIRVSQKKTLNDKYDNHCACCNHGCNGRNLNGLCEFLLVFNEFALFFKVRGDFAQEGVSGGFYFQNESVHVHGYLHAVCKSEAHRTCADEIIASMGFANGRSNIP